ncbi:hypothetical protein BB560_005589 [Smittium megazygosporum]|uniref:Aminotransferase class I/classII large domain-containing protein n=1 Tax=Smittium megazygosporum TaxID=133381 RepID=A0A2T9Z2T8_9FUNG|nr:hypothetical protein BB560_005589 [Smittium megazygosporum]
MSFVLRVSKKSALSEPARTVFRTLSPVGSLHSKYNCRLTPAIVKRNKSSAKSDSGFSEKYPVPYAAYRNAKLDVWTMFNMAAAKANAVNLGQGFMNFPADKMVLKAGSDAISDPVSAQYAPPRGLPILLSELAKRYTASLKTNIDPAKNIMISSGANEGIFCGLLAFLGLNTNSEAIVIEPAFDQYTPNIIMAGGKPVYVPLRVNSNLNPESHNISSNEWKLDCKELEAKINSNTKVLIVNTPHNPTELEEIAEIAKKHNLLVISDEVYENLYYDGEKHISIASLPGMLDRTIVIGSVGKMFGVTGWRIGWLIGGEHLITACIAAHTRTTFVSPTPIQLATAYAFQRSVEFKFFETQRAQYLERRNKLMKLFDQINLPYSVPKGSYFLLVNSSRISIPKDFEIPDHVKERGRSFSVCYFLTVKIGIACIPPTEFYSEENMHLAEDYVRFAFCKSDDVFVETEKRLSKLVPYLV